MENEFQIIVVGAGIVGLNVALRLQRRGGRVLLVEAADRVGSGTTSRNSGVVHAGLFYPPESLKTRLCVRGNQLTCDWCRAKDVPLNPCGKWLVATTTDEENALAAIVVKCGVVGVEGLRWLSDDEIRRRQPELRVRTAVEVPSSAIVDVHALVASVEAAFLREGGTLVRRHIVRGVEGYSAGYRLTLGLPDGDTTDVTASMVVNAAGLAADEVAAMVGIDVDAARYRQHYWKGNLFRVPGARGRFPRLVYPIPPVGAPHLGAHIVPDMAGNVRLGPDAEFLNDRIPDYAVKAERALPVWGEAHAYWPGLRPEDLEPDYAGIRPKLVASKGFRDFVIAEESARNLPGWVNLVGIESPGLTAAPAIGEEVERRLFGSS